MTPRRDRTSDVSEVLAYGEGAPPLEDDNVFLRAIDVLHERGWTQGRLAAPDGRVCAIGALRTATYGYPRREEGAFDALARSHLAYTVNKVSVAVWNDAPYRSYEDVVLALKEAASTWPGDCAAAEPPSLAKDTP